MRDINVARINQVSIYALAGAFSAMKRGQANFAEHHDIWNAVQTEYDTTAEQIRAHAGKRFRIYTEPRFMLMFLLYQFDKRRPSLKTVGEEVGQRLVKMKGHKQIIGFDHTTVLNAIQAITDWCDSDPYVRGRLHRILTRLDLVSTKTETISKRTIQSTRQWINQQKFQHSMQNSATHCSPCYFICVCPS